LHQALLTIIPYDPKTNPEFVTLAESTVGKNADRDQIALLDFANLLVGGNLHFFLAYSPFTGANLLA
jgi:hypothetical protein